MRRNEYYLRHTAFKLFYVFIFALVTIEREFIACMFF